MRGTLPMIECDAEDGLCGARDDDYYEQDVSAVDGVRITRAEPAPGWRVINGQDYCPDHANAIVAAAEQVADIVGQHRTSHREGGER